MSDAHARQAASAGETIRIEAADWILRRRTAEDWTEAHQQELDAWLNRSTAHLLAYLRLEAAWKQTDRLAALRTPMRSDGAPAPRRPFLVQIAAVIGIVAIAGVISMSHFWHPRERVFATAIGAREHVVLGDGTSIELNTDTRIHMANDAGARTVYLDRGEAYFHVKHDSVHPFMVIADGHRITDVGTAFDIRQTARAFSVALVNGRARFDISARSDLKPFDLTPGDEVVATANRVTRTREPAAELARQLSWRRGVLVFYATTLADATTEFNRYSTVKLVIPDPKVAQLRINGTFHINDVGAFVDATKVVLGLKLEAHDREIIISQ